jgi:hypothetical protein
VLTSFYRIKSYSRSVTLTTAAKFPDSKRESKLRKDFTLGCYAGILNGSRRHPIVDFFLGLVEFFCCWLETISEMLTKFLMGSLVISWVSRSIYSYNQQ